MPEMKGLAFAVAAFTLLAGSAAMARAERPQGPPFPRLALMYSAWVNTGDLRISGEPVTAQELARFDLLVGVSANWRDRKAWPALRAQFAALKKANPHLIVLDFGASAPYAYPRLPNWASFATVPPESAWLRQANGEHIAGWPGTDMLNLTKPEAIAWVADTAVAPQQTGAYDGVFIDCMGGAFDRWACEIATGKPYTVDADEDGTPDAAEALDRQWRAAKTELCRQVRTRIGDRPVFMANQAGDFAFDELNGIYLEDYVDYVIAGTMSFDDVLREYLHWTQTRRRPNVTVLGACSGVEPPFDPWNMPKVERHKLLEAGRSQLARMRFGLAMALMGDGYYSFDLHTRDRGQNWWYPEYDAPLGYPKGVAAKQDDGSWRREFDGGLVVVNPTEWDVPVRFGERREDVSSRRVATDFVVPAMDGRIFLPTQKPAQAGDLPEPEPPLTREGPPGIFRRGERAVARWGDGSTAALDAAGNVTRVSGPAGVLITGIRPVIVADERWQDFSASSISCRTVSGNRLAVTGRRTNGDQALSYEETVSLDGDSLVLEYRWRALSPLRLHDFRHALAFPAETFARGAARSGARRAALPEAPSPSLSLGGLVRALTLTASGGASVRVEVSRDGTFWDDRIWHGPGYLLGFTPVRGVIEAGREWTYRIVVTPGAK
jgi:hypothetical protein